MSSAVGPYAVERAHCQQKGGRLHRESLGWPEVAQSRGATLPGTMLPPPRVHRTWPNPNQHTVTWNIEPAGLLTFAKTSSMVPPTSRRSASHRRSMFGSMEKNDRGRLVCQGGESIDHICGSRNGSWSACFWKEGKCMQHGVVLPVGCFSNWRVRPSDFIIFAGPATGAVISGCSSNCKEGPLSRSAAGRFPFTLPSTINCVLFGLDCAGGFPDPCGTFWGTFRKRMGTRNEGRRNLVHLVQHRESYRST